VRWGKIRQWCRQQLQRRRRWQLRALRRRVAFTHTRANWPGPSRPMELALVGASPACLAQPLWVAAEARRHCTRRCHRVGRKLSPSSVQSRCPQRPLAPAAAAAIGVGRQGSTPSWRKPLSRTVALHHHSLRPQIVTGQRLWPLICPTALRVLGALVTAAAASCCRLLRAARLCHLPASLRPLRLWLLAAPAALLALETLRPPRGHSRRLMA